MNSTPVVLVIGDVITDITAVYSGPIAVGSDTPSRISIGGGGAAANLATWLAWLGVPAELVAVIGTDAAGDQRLAELRDCGVGVAGIRRTTQASTGAVIVLATSDDRTMLADRRANLMLTPSDVDNAITNVAEIGHVHVSGYVLLDAASRPAGRHALEVAAQRGLGTSVDVASAAPIRAMGGTAMLDAVRGVGLLLANLDEARALLQDDDGEPAELARRLTAVASWAVVKLGPAGAVMAGPGGELDQIPAEPATVIDPTGAGDAFAAGLLAGAIATPHAARPSQWLVRAARTAAVAVTTVGARPPKESPAS